MPSWSRKPRVHCRELLVACLSSDRASRGCTQTCCYLVIAAHHWRANSLARRRLTFAALPAAPKPCPGASAPVWPPAPCPGDPAPFLGSSELFPSRPAPLCANVGRRASSPARSCFAHQCSDARAPACGGGMWRFQEPGDLIESRVLGRTTPSVWLDREPTRPAGVTLGDGRCCRCFAGEGAPGPREK